MGSIINSLFGSDAPPAPAPAPGPKAESIVKTTVDTSVARAKAKKRKARLAGSRGLLSGGFRGFGDSDKLGG